MAEPFHLDPKHEKTFLLVAGIASIAGFALYMRNMGNPAATTADTPGSLTGDVGGAGDVQFGAISQALSANQDHMDAALTALTQSEQTGFAGLSATLAQNQTDFLAALQTIVNNPGSGTGTGTATGPTVNLDLSVQGLYDNNRDSTWDNTTSGSTHDSGSTDYTTSGSETHSGSSGGSGWFGFHGFGIGGGGSHSSSGSSEYSDENATTWDNATSTFVNNSGSQNNTMHTELGQNITLSETGLGSDDLYNLENNLFNTSKRAQTAAVNPLSLATPYLFPRLPGSQIANPGQFGFNRPSQYSSAAENVNRDASYNNWSLVPGIGHLPGENYHA